MDARAGKGGQVLHLVPVRGYRAAGILRTMALPIDKNYSTGK